MGTEKRIDIILAKVRHDMWKEAVEDAQELPYFDTCLKSDLEAIYCLHKGIRTPREGIPVYVKARRDREEDWGEWEEDWEENLEDYYYMGFDIYRPWPRDVEENGIDIMSALLYDERINTNPDKEDLEEVNYIIEKNRELIEVYRKIRKEGRGPEEAKKLAMEEMYERWEREEGFEELPF